MDNQYYPNARISYQAVLSVSRGFLYSDMLIELVILALLKDTLNKANTTLKKKLTEIKQFDYKNKYILE